MNLRGVSALGTLIGFFIIMIALGVLWVASGGPSRPISRAGPFLTPPSAPYVDFENGTIVSGGQSTVDAGGTPLPEAHETDTGTNLIDSIVSGNTSANSPYAADVELQKASATQSDKNKEYVTISISRKASGTFTVTGWVLESTKQSVKAPLGSAANLFISGQVNSTNPVTVGPGSTIYVTTGRPQAGVALRVNKCTGYLDQFQAYYPSLKHQCPYPEDEIETKPTLASDYECVDFVEGLSSCRAYIDAIPAEIQSTCRAFVTNDLTYAGCVALHRNDPDFYQNEWRMYLSRDQELWANTHDTIRLLDENGKLIASVSY